MAAFQTPPWRLISGILAVTCLGLMAALRILWKHSLPKQSLQPTSSPGATEPQDASDCCSCQEKWIGYRCNCYFISNEKKTWAESRDFCASQNSSLLQLENKDELNFTNHIIYLFWIGLSYNEEKGAWMWEDGSAVSSVPFSTFQPVNTQNCVVYGTNAGVHGEACGMKSRYICKKQLKAVLGVS